MATTYTTRQGDTLDWIAWNHYGKQSGAVESVLAANPRLADEGIVLPLGLVIVLPELAPEVTETVVRLWE